MQTGFHIELGGAVVNTKEKNYGIVLRTHLPEKYKLSVLDNSLGKIDAIPLGKKITHQICNGYFIHYWCTQTTSLATLDQIEIQEIPQVHTEQDILFLHHVLEMCHYFLPLHMHAPDVFMLVRRLYTVDYMVLTPLAKKIFLMKLFIALGFYPDDNRLQKAEIHMLAYGPIDNILNKKISLDIEQDLDTWLMLCIKTHPYHDEFKTAHFLDKVKI